jgi:hypothetical protein
VPSTTASSRLKAGGTKASFWPPRVSRAFGRPFPLSGRCKMSVRREQATARQGLAGDPVAVPVKPVLGVAVVPSLSIFLACEV